MGGKIFRRAEKDIKNRIKDAKKIIFFLDYDGTLTPIKKRPSLAKIDGRTKTVLKKLKNKTWSKVFIISGRSLKDIRRLIGLRGLYYVGNHGIELEGPRAKYLNPAAKALKPAIQKSYRELKKKIEFKGVLLENKIYTLSIHYRMVNPSAVPAFKHIFKDTIKNLKKNKRIKVTEGKKVFEIRPNIKWDKGRIVKRILKERKLKKALPIYIGDDKTDEDAFRVLGKNGITILVSKERKKTMAQYRLCSPGEVIKFLKFITKLNQ